MMEPPATSPASRRFLWCAVLAGLLPTLSLGGVAFYLAALSVGIATARDSGKLLPFLLAISGFLTATLFAYWRVIWLYSEGRRLGSALWLGSWLLMLAWFVWFAWGFISYGPGGLVGLGLALWPFLCWGYALMRG